MFKAALSTIKDALPEEVKEAAKKYNTKEDWSVANPWMSCPLLQVAASMTSLYRERWLAGRLKKAIFLGNACLVPRCR